jgi:hypothetical protein
MDRMHQEMSDASGEKIPDLLSIFTCRPCPAIINHYRADASRKFMLVDQLFFHQIDTGYSYKQVSYGCDDPKAHLRR